MRYSLKDFLPLITIFLLICLFTITRQFMAGEWNMMQAMNDFMAGFFIIFGSFKIINLRNFAKAYREYDLLAKKSIGYAYLYPFIEIGLGVAYLFQFMPIATNVITYVVMLFSAVGVALELAEGKQIMCACLGMVFKLPMTYVTLFEDLLMAGMALGMLLHLLI